VYGDPIERAAKVEQLEREGEFERMMKKPVTPRPGELSDFEKLLKKPPVSPRIKVLPALGGLLGGIFDVAVGVLMPGPLSDEAPRPDDKPNPFVIPIPNIPQGIQGPPEPPKPGDRRGRGIDRANTDTGERYDPKTFELGPNRESGIDDRRPSVSADASGENGLKKPIGAFRQRRGLSLPPLVGASASRNAPIGFLSPFSPEASADTSSRPAPQPAPSENFPTHYDPLPAPAPQPSPSPLPQPLTSSSASSSNCPPCTTRRRPKRPSDKVPNVKPYKRRMSLNSLDNLRRG
jgi:hypothetical protein